MFLTENLLYTVLIFSDCILQKLPLIYDSFDVSNLMFMSDEQKYFPEFKTNSQWKNE